MAPKALFRTTALMLLLIFPAQLLALAFLPCRHAAGPAEGPLPSCHAVAADLRGQAPTDDRDSSGSALEDCGKCQMESVFSSMHGTDSVSEKVRNATPLAVHEPLPHFYHLYPDALKRPPRRDF